MTSATGSEPVIGWPVGRVSPVSSAFSRRSSTGSISSACASLSICASAAKQVCTAPKPRIAPHGGLFVKTLVVSIRAFGTAYGPHANDAAFAVTAVELDAYAPPSSRMLHPHADEPAVAGCAVLGANARRVAVHVARERLLPVVDHLHGSARVQREQRRVNLDRQILAAAERAADAGEMDADLLLGQAETRRDLLAVDVQPLRGDVDVDAALAVRNGEPGLGAEERLILDAELVRALDDDVAPRVGVAVDDPHRAQDVRPRVAQVVVADVRLGVRVQRLRLGRSLRVDDRDEGLVLDDDQLRGPARLLRVLGGDDRDRLAEVAHAVDREHGLVLKLEPVRLAPGHVGVREHRMHARDGERAREIDRTHARVRVRAAQRVTPEHSGDLQIARVLELPVVFGIPSTRRTLSPIQPRRTSVPGMTLLISAPAPAKPVPPLIARLRAYGSCAARPSKIFA